MTGREAQRRLKRTPTPDTSGDAIIGIEERVGRLREAGDPHGNVATLEYLLRLARERPADRRESVALLLYGLDNPE